MQHPFSDSTNPHERGGKKTEVWDGERVCVGIKQGMKRIKRGNTDMM